MDEIRDYIINKCSDSELAFDNYISYDGESESLLVYINDFVSPEFKYTTNPLFYDEYYSLMCLERTPWIDCIICLFVIRDDNPDTIPYQFIKDNKHLIVRIVQNSGWRMYDSISDNINLIVEGDKHLIKELAFKKRLNIKVYNSLQIYCSASYSDFRFHNDWDLSFFYI